MRYAAILLCAALLTGCADVTVYQPYITDVTDPAALASDKVACLVHAHAYKPPTDLASLATAAGVGAGDNLAGAAITPLVPALGAAGGVAVAGMKAVGLNSTDQIRVYLRCLSNRSLRSGAYEMNDPNL